MSDRVGIMSNGVLQQVGVPQEIYNNPANGFVASFVGENNVIPGRVIAATNGSGRIETAFGTFNARLGPGIAQGNSAKLYVRPEHSILAPVPDTGRNALPVEVTEVAFEGNFINVHARGDQGGVYMAQVHNDPGEPVPDVGQRLHLNFAPEHSVVLSDAVGGRA
jgi:spermidine/putrescine transport system ATP-binding protein